MRLRGRIVGIGFVCGVLFSSVALAVAQTGEKDGGSIHSDSAVKPPTVPPPGVDAAAGFDPESHDPTAVPVPVDPGAIPTDDSDDAGGPPNYISDHAVDPGLLDHCRETVSAQEAAQTEEAGDADRADETFICKMIIAKAQGDLAPGGYTDSQLADGINRADLSAESP